MMQATTETMANAPGRVRKDAGAEAKLRRCVVSQTTAPRATLLRLVASPDGVLTPDVAARLPGRGIWFTPTRAAIAEGIQRKAFQKALRGPVKVPDDFADLVERLLLQRLLDAVGLARRAGDAVAGAAKADEWLANGRVGLTFLASDAGADARRRWHALPASVERLMVLSGDEIGRVFGRDRAAHLVVKNCPLKQRLINDAGRLAGMRIAGTGPADAPKTGNGE